MSIEAARKHLQTFGLEDRIIEPEQSSATVELAAQALGCKPEHIAKTLSFDLNGDTILIVTAGDAKIDNKKYREYFGCKAKMLPREQVLEKIGHDVGGVCPFGIHSNIKVYTDCSLQRFETVYPAAGNDTSGVRLSCEELFRASNSKAWIDVCKGWQTEES